MSHEQDLAAFGRFQEQLSSWGARYSGAWFCGLAMRLASAEGALGVAIARILLRTPGLTPWRVPAGRFLRLAGDAAAVSRELSDDELAAVQTSFKSDHLPHWLDEMFGERVVVPPEPPNHITWSFCVDRYVSAERWAGLHLVRQGHGELHRVFGGARLEHTNTALKLPDVGIDGFRELSERLGLQHRFQGENYIGQRPTIDIAAELPIRFRAFRYDAVRGALIAEVHVGTQVDLDRGVISLLGGAETGRRLADCVPCGLVTTGLKRLQAVLECKKPTAPVKATLIYDGMELGEHTYAVDESPTRIVTPSTFRGVATIGDTESDSWDSVLREEHRVTRRQVSGWLSKTLPKATARRTLERTRDAVLLANRFPFWSLAASASVVEVVLRVALSRVPPQTLRQACETKGRSLPKGDPAAYGLAQAIDCAFDTGLLKDEHLLGSHALRKLRNGIHIEIDRMSPSITPGDAAAALSATIAIVRELALQDKRGREPASG